MSGLYIPGMKKPASCDACLIPMTWCMNHQNKDYPHCPLIEVPEHGRLIDADAIPYNKIMLQDDDFYYGVTMPYIDRMPTVIPADGGAE